MVEYKGTFVLNLSRTKKTITFTFLRSKIANLAIAMFKIKPSKNGTFRYIGGLKRYQMVPLENRLFKLNIHAFFISTEPLIFLNLHGNGKISTK